MHSKKVLKKIIKPYIQNKCIPLASMQRQYMAKSPIKLFDLIQILNKKKSDDVPEDTKGFRKTVSSLKFDLGGKNEHEKFSRSKRNTMNFLEKGITGNYIEIQEMDIIPENNPNNLLSNNEKDK